jgi:hypothetical protein
MVRRYSLGLIAIFALAVAVVHADDFWVKKDWKQWSKEDCAKILKDSPWTKKWTQTKANVGLPSSNSNVGNGTGGASGGTSGGGLDPLGTGVTGSSSGSAGDSKEEVFYVVELASSLAIREAQVRMQQIQVNYEKLDADKKKTFDERAAAYLGRTYDDVIIFHVTYDASNQALLRALTAYWQSIPEDSVPTDLYMITDHGDHVSPVHFASVKGGGNTFDIQFPRTKGSEPLISPNDKSLSLQIPHPAVVDLVAERALVVFKLDKMTINGKLTF